MLQILILSCVLLIDISQLVNGEDKLFAGKKIDAKTLARQLYKIDAIDDLTNLGFEKLPTLTKSRIVTGKGSKFAKFTENLPDATPGKCDPKPVCIANPLSLELKASNQLAYPSCINIHHCGGCCPENEVCVATKTVDVRLKNVGIINIAGNEVSYKDDTVSVKNHTDCECRCQWEKDEDCHTINPNYVKDPSSCACVCPSVVQCSAFHTFDPTECKCVCSEKKFGKLETWCKQRNMKWNDKLCKCESSGPVLLSKYEPNRN